MDIKELSKIKDNAERLGLTPSDLMLYSISNSLSNIESGFAEFTQVLKNIGGNYAIEVDNAEGNPVLTAIAGLEKKLNHLERVFYDSEALTDTPAEEPGAEEPVEKPANPVEENADNA